MELKKIALFFFLFLLVLPTAFAQQQWSIGYYTPWGNPGCPISDIDMGALTHVVHWAALVNADGSLDLNYQLISTDAPTMVATAHAAGVKAILGVVNPYWLGQSGNMSAATANNRAGLVRNIMNVVNTYGYDGVDIDWEGGTLTTTSTDGANFRALASDLKTQLGSKPLMAAAVVTDSAYWGASHTSFDRVNIMTYDMSGTWDTYSWHNAALYDQDGMVWSINLAVSRYTAAGVPASKLGIGIPFYGWQWTGVTGPKQTGATGASQIYYQNLASMISNPQWDSLAKVPWQGGTNTFLSFDNAQSIAEKVNYAKSKALGGWIIWELSGDYIPTANPKHPLLSAVKSAMGPVSTITPPTITSSSPLSAGTVGIAYSQTLTATGTAPITWSISSGSVPAGLALGANTGVISGTPTIPGTSSFTVKATGGNSATATQSLSLTIASVPIATSQQALQFIPATPCRIMDTRTSGGFTGAFGPPSLSASSTRSVPIPYSSCGIPATAQVYSLNITVVPKVSRLNYVTVWPAGQPQPAVSTLNSWDGKVIANAALVPAGTGGAINVFTSDSTDLVIDINGYFILPSVSSQMFYPLAPCRVLDTRKPVGMFGGPSLSAGISQSFPLPLSSCGIPASARSYSLNVTVVPKGALGFVTAWPTGQPQPFVSTLNSFDGTTLANAAIVPAGTNGSVSFYASNDTDLVVDINGYFAPPGPGGLNFYAATPCRLADTRNATGTFGGPMMSAGQTRAFPLPQSACALPATAQAYSLNMTVVPPGPLYYLSVWPVGVPQPLVSTLNDFKGLAVANAALVPAGASGAINAYATSSSHLIIDMNGYFGQ